MSLEIYLRASPPCAAEVLLQAGLLVCYPTLFLEFLLCEATPLFHSRIVFVTLLDYAHQEHLIALHEVSALKEVKFHEVRVKHKDKQMGITFVSVRKSGSLRWRKDVEKIYEFNFPVGP